jgi:hypothetical protein
MKLEYNINLFFGVVLILSLVYFGFALNDANDVFEANVLSVNNYNSTFSVLIGIENKVDSDLSYNIEVVYKKQNLVVGREKFVCYGVCDVEIELKKIFFDDYEVFISTKYNKKSYERILSFFIEKPQSVVVEMDDVFYLEGNSVLSVSGQINSLSDEQRRYFVSIYPVGRYELVKDFNLTCFSSVCGFEFNLTSNIVEHEYNFDLYASDDTIQERFEVVFLNYSAVNKSHVNEMYNLSHNQQFTIQDGAGRYVKARVVLLRDDVFLDSFYTEKGRISPYGFEKNNVDFVFDKGNVKKISVPGAVYNDVAMRFEEVPVEKVDLIQTVNHAFAIDPYFPSDVESYNITFVATGVEVYKCSDYDFTNQDCFGEYEKILDTVPGREYTITLTPTDPIIAQVSDYLLSPIDAECQDQGGGWALSNCQDQSLSGSKSCPAGASGERTFCYDNLTEMHTVKKDLAGGVRMFFNDTSQDRCENITKVEVVHKVSWSSTTGTRTIAVSRDGSSWTNAVSGPAQNPTANIVTDVTSTLSWDCDDFFSDSANAGIQVLWSITGGNPNSVYTMDVDTLIYRVTYNYTQYALETDKNTYQQGETILVTGSDLWDANADIGLNLTWANGTFEDLGNYTTNSTGDFNFSYVLDDYAVLGDWEFAAIQLNDSSKNSTKVFEVVKREPEVWISQDYVSRGESVEFDGEHWGKNISVSVVYKYPSNELNPAFNDVITTEDDGTFSYDFTFPDSLLYESGDYTFVFSEVLNSSYNKSVSVDYIFRPSSASTSLASLNRSDGVFYNLGGGGGTQTIDVGFPQVLPNSGTELDSYVVYLEYYTSGTATRTLLWLNDTSGAYQTVCTIPASASKTTYGCNLTSYANYLSDYNSLNIRLSETGGPSEHWYIDFAYARRDFTYDGPDVTLLNPHNDSVYLDNQYFNFTYKVTSPFFNMSSCSIYFNGSMNTTDNNITNVVNQYFNNSYYFAEGSYNWMVSCVEDSTKQLRGNSSIFVFLVDLTAPDVDLVSPLHNSSSNANVNYFVGNFSDNLGLLNASLLVWNSSGSLVFVNSSLVSGRQNSSNLSVSFLQSGVYYWNYFVYDRAGHSSFASNNYTIFVDFIPPEVNLVSPLNDTMSNVLTHYFNASFSDDLSGLANATLEIYNASGSLVGFESVNLSGNADSASIDFTFADEGWYYWNYKVYDDAGNVGYSDVNYSIMIDLTAPVVELVHPDNGSYGAAFVSFEGNFSDDLSGLLNATLLIYNESGSLIGTSSDLVSGNVNSTILNYTFIEEGIYYWNYLVYDVVGNGGVRSTNKTIIIDLTPPVVELASPLNSSFFNVSVVEFTGNFSDNVRLQNATLFIYNESGSVVGSVFENVSGVLNQTKLNYTFVKEGLYYWNYLVFDIVGNAGWAESNFTVFVDVTPPRIDFVLPTELNDSWINRTLSWIDINVSVTDLSFNSSWLEWNYSSNEDMDCTFVSGFDYYCYMNKSKILNGRYSYRVCANDSVGSVNCTEERVININKTLPEITVISPVDKSKFVEDNNFDVNITTRVEANTTWYEVDLNGTKFLLGNDGAFLNWSRFHSEYLDVQWRNLTFFANDTVGNVVSKMVQVYVIPKINYMISKKIGSAGENVYEVVLTITNYANYKKIFPHDFVDGPFSYYDVTPGLYDSDSVSGLGYNGNITKWNLSVNQFDTQYVKYNMSGAGDYSLRRNYILGSE